MTLAEFKAWFEGFTEDMAGAPSKKQWERIKARVEEIDGKAVTYPVYVDRYWKYDRPYWVGSPPLWNTPLNVYGSASLQSSIPANATIMAVTGSSNHNGKPEPFDSTAAMHAAGRADATELAA